MVTCAHGLRVQGLRRTALLGVGALLVGGLPVLASALPASAAVPGKVSGSVQTTNITGTAVNLNHYAAKTDVYLSGGPNNTNAHFLEEGDYFFAILVPGGQSDPNDSGAGNLSSPIDSAVDRSFHADGAGGAFALPGTQHFISPALTIQTFDFNDTTNNGGVYIAAVCQYVPTSELDPTAQPVEPKDCKYDAFKVGESTPPSPDQVAPSAAKTAVATHDRDVHWTISKSVENYSNDVNGQTLQGSPRTVDYTVTATKSATDTYGVTGTVTVYNTNENPLDVTVTEDGLDPSTTDTCSLDNDATLLVPGEDANGDPGQNSVDYTCSFDPAPDTNQNYANAATVTYDLGLGDGPQELAVASDPFTFPAPTYLPGSDPETISVTDAFDGGAATPLSPPTASDTYTWTYSRTLSNYNCHTYPNTVSIVENGQSASTSVTVCGANSGGMNTTWWKGTKGQTILKANTGPACGTVNGYIPALVAHGSTVYLPDAYTSAKYPASTYYYVRSQCTTASAKSYLPTLDLNVIAVATAAGSGTKMLEGQWLTTALNVATYTNSTSGGKPTLKASQKVVIATALRGSTNLGLASCDTIGNVLTAASGKYKSYATAKPAITSALVTLLTRINSNQAQTCK